VGPKPNITRQAYKTLVLPVLSYGCHLFANRLDTVAKQKALSKLNRLACLSLGSVPPGTPTATMVVLYNLRPLDLELERIALKTYNRIKNKLPCIWNGLPTGRGGRVGHLRYWERKTNLFGIKVTEADNDLQAKLRTWERNFEVMDFETMQKMLMGRIHATVMEADWLITPDMVM
jgi:hypothetical protein